MQHRAGQQLPPRFGTPSGPPFGGPGSQYRLPQQQQLLQQQRQRALQQQGMGLPGEPLGLHPGLQQQEHQRRALQQHMALLQLQQQQQGGYEHLDAAHVADLQGNPLAGSLGSDALVSNEALLGLQAQACVTSSPVTDEHSSNEVLQSLGSHHLIRPAARVGINLSGGFVTRVPVMKRSSKKW